MDKQQIKELILELLEDDDIRKAVNDIVMSVGYDYSRMIEPGSIAIFSSDDDD